MKQITAQVNGEVTPVAPGTTIGDLATKFKLEPTAVLVELNRVALHQHEWPEMILEEGDQLEFVRVVAGG